MIDEVILHDEHTSHEEVNHEDDGHAEEKLEESHVPAPNALAAPGTVVVEALHTEPAVGTVLGRLRILPVDHFAQVAVKMRSIGMIRQNEMRFLLEYFNFIKVALRMQIHVSRWKPRIHKHCRQEAEVLDG